MVCDAPDHNVTTPARLRAAIVASGSELVRGDRYDRNGPYLASSLLRLGIDPARITVVGDDPADLEAALRDGLAYDLLCVSGGLGPTHDDRTIELLARAAGVGLRVDEELAAAIEELSRRVAVRLGRPYTDFEDGVRKQATLPEGASWVGLVGTAPAVVLDAGACTVVALPGPPRELQQLWPLVLETEPLQRLLARASVPERRVLRFYGVSESAVAQALAAAGGDGGGVDVTICARDFEIHVDLLGGGDELAELLRRELAEYLFSEDERPVAELVLDECRLRGLTLATAESCTGGLVAELLTAIPGSSDVFLGAIVAYSDQVKVEQLGVPAALIEEHGAVSAEVARAMADGARRHLGVDIAVAVTGVAGPDGGTPEKPVGTVYIDARVPDGGRGIHFALPGDRGVVRRRAAVASLHLVRQILGTER